MTEFTLIPLSINLSQSSALEKEQGDVESSIHNILDLIIFTPKGTFAADPEFGFEYWNHEFSNINVREFNNSYLGMVSDAQILNDVSRKQCEQSLKESILSYEPRLLNPEVRIELDVNNNDRKRKSLSKYEMRIMITGAIDDGLGIARQFEKKVAFMVEPTVRNDKK